MITVIHKCTVANVHVLYPQIAQLSQNNDNGLLTGLGAKGYSISISHAFFEVLNSWEKPCKHTCILNYMIFFQYFHRVFELVEKQDTSVQ